MIELGLSPYFVKYGYAEFPANHDRYATAERKAQEAQLGVWNQLAHNGGELNNYAVLTTWWALRAKVVDEYRQYLAANPANPVLDTRLDYEALLAAAGQRKEASIFTDLREIRQVSGHAVIKVGSRTNHDRRFNVFIPNAYTSSSGASIMNLIHLRYLPGDVGHPRRGYAYLEGPLDMFGGTPQIRIESTSQISDSPP